MEALWVILTLLVAAGAGWPVTIGVLRFARSVEKRDTTEGRERPDALEPPEPQARKLVIPAPPARGPETPAKPVMPEPRPGVLRGGLVIGILERLGVAGAILADEPVAIAYVVAIKGLGRYAELKETPAVSERFIIGTLASLLWAAAVAVVAARFLL